ncbi:MAG: diguanylate cyclase [candidate division Zixibacteria bacterium]|nr:diguanylate cyclase [candidate division Zixibacteria bacterium]
MYEISRVDILLIENDLAQVNRIEKLLKLSKSLSSRLEYSFELSKGLEYLSEKKKDIILLDLYLPDSKGLETLRTVYSEANDIPILIISDSDNELLAAQALRGGAQDYILKEDLNPGMLSRVILYAIRRKQAELRLREQECRLSQIIEGGSVPTLVLDREHRVTHWNKACEALTEKTAEEMIGTTNHWSAFYCHERPLLADLILDENTDSIQKYYTGEIRQSSLVEGAYEAVDYLPCMGRQGRWLFFTAAPLYDQGGEIIGSVETFLDITERKRIENRLKRRTKDLRRTVSELKSANSKIAEQQKKALEDERMKTILQIAGVAAHDIKQPLTVLMGHIDLMKDEPGNPENLKQHIDEIDECSVRISKILNRFKNVRLIDTGASQTTASIIPDSISARMLLIEDDPQDFKALKGKFNKYPGIKISHASSMREGLDKIMSENFEVILLDYSLPDGDGLKFLTELRSLQKEIPVIVISGQGDEIIASRVIQMGAYDYLPKPAIGDGEILVRSIATVLEKSHIKLELKRTQEKLVEMSTRDEMTGLYNRRYFMEALDREISRALRYNSDLVLCVIDLDNFKLINDSFGHPAGDMIIECVGKILKSHIRDSDLICRFGGEEFAAIFPGIDIDDAARVCGRFCETLAKQNFEYEGKSINATMSAGLASLHELRKKTRAELVRAADSALYRSKDTGRDRITLHSALATT